MSVARVALSRPVVVRDIPRKGADIRVETTPEERERLARAFKLVGLDELAGRYHVTPTAGGARVTGEVRARLRQICVVSLEEFTTELREPVDLAYAAPDERAAAHDAPRGELVIDPDADDPPEPLVNGRIDLGAVTAEFLALGIDPYPHKPGIAFSYEAPPAVPPSPFEALAVLKAKQRPTKD